MTKYLVRRRDHVRDIGATSVEYALLLTFITLAVVGAVAAFGTVVAGLFTLS